MLCTLLSGALRRGAGQLKMTWLPRCTPDKSSVRWTIRSTGGNGGLRFPHVGASDKPEIAISNITNWRETDVRLVKVTKLIGTKIKEVSENIAA
jgi:hypothetical protein